MDTTKRIVIEPKNHREYDSGSESESLSPVYAKNGNVNGTGTGSTTDSHNQFKPSEVSFLTADPKTTPDRKAPGALQKNDTDTDNDNDTDEEEDAEIHTDISDEDTSDTNTKTKNIEGEKKTPPLQSVTTETPVVNAFEEKKHCSNVEECVVKKIDPDAGEDTEITGLSEKDMMLMNGVSCAIECALREYFSCSVTDESGKTSSITITEAIVQLTKQLKQLASLH